MGKKIVTSAENLALLDLIIAKKREGRIDEDYIVNVGRTFIIIIEGFTEGGFHHVQDIPVESVLDKVSNAVTKVLKDASVEQLVELRESIGTR
ncbi:hypothetical protein JN11_04445 [Mucilaginibacter frigoritolerans]|uniref:Uncharacterized protein n=1 Tax=Mucilaginibacter frigoritolerans TaxID=652788 RepID=A0A562TRA3_9SPHI|nr:hypothetical protein [Mucilaginibacter frigoritolerans]TWI95330.1 hypothetical protein JN11_04445 [Mucilaginibacter frigoritolerans]